MSNSLFEFTLELILACHSDMASSYGTDLADFERDSVEIRKRSSCEGIGFLTKTLPRIGKAVDTALANGTALSVPGFETSPGSAVPKFLGVLLQRVFDKQGYERSDASAMVLAQVRQLLYMVYKLEIPSTESQNNRVLTDFVKTDIGLSTLRLAGTDGPLGALLATARTIVCKVVGCIDPRDIVPRHGPGVVSTGEKPWEKKVFKRYYRRLSRFYSYEEYFYYNASHFTDELKSYLRFAEHNTGQAKVCLVPKDSRGPRLISCEPLEYQWIQQGLGRLLMRTIEENQWTRGQVNFTDQNVNRNLAMYGSRSGIVSTLDLKDASDRVSLELVWCLFRGSSLMEALYAARTTHTRLPDGTVFPLHKFAPMGSALCFPVEALVFWAIAVAALMHSRSLPFNKAARRVWVYGDDIVCFTRENAVIRQALESVGLAVNNQKCCTAGFFRESCGCDAYRGVDVTPTKIRKLPSPSQPESLASWCAYQHAFEAKGYYGVSDVIIGFLAEAGIRRRPTVDQDCGPVTGYYSDRLVEGDYSLFILTYRHPELACYPTRWSQKRHQREGFMPVLKTKKFVDKDLSWRELLRVHTLNSTEEAAGLYPLRRGVSLKRRWIAI